MRATQQVRYAIYGVFDLAYHGGSRPVPLAEVGERQAIPARYLEQIFQKLRRAGLVTSKRGPGGGYRLARRPDAIALAEVVRAVQGTVLGPAEAGRRDCAQCPEFVWELVRADVERRARAAQRRRPVSRGRRARHRARRARPGELRDLSWPTGASAPPRARPVGRAGRAAARAPARGFPARARVLSGGVLRAAHGNGCAGSVARGSLHERPKSARGARRVEPRRAAARSGSTSRSCCMRCGPRRHRARSCSSSTTPTSTPRRTCRTPTSPARSAPGGEPLYPGSAQLVVSVRESGVGEAALFVWDAGERGVPGPSGGR